MADLLSRTAGVADVAAVMRPPVGSPPAERLAYRNKMEFSFSSQVWQPGQEKCAISSSSAGSRAGGATSSRRGGPPRSSARPRSAGASGGSFALGLHRPGSTSEVLPISRCHLQPDAANALLQRILALCRQAGLRPFDPHTGQGLLQDVVLRRGTPSRLGGSSAPASSAAAGTAEPAEADWLVNFVTARDGRQALAPVAAALMQAAPPHGAAAVAAAEGSAGSAALPPAPAVVGVVNSVSQRGRPVGERRLAAEHVLAGRGTLTETLCGVEFEVRWAGPQGSTSTPANGPEASGPELARRGAVAGSSVEQLAWTLPIPV